MLSRLRIQLRTYSRAARPDIRCRAELRLKDRTRAKLSEKELTEYFSACGPVLTCAVIRTPPHTYAFVEFDDARSALRAVEHASETMLAGFELRCDLHDITRVSGAMTSEAEELRQLCCAAAVFFVVAVAWHLRDLETVAPLDSHVPPLATGAPPSPLDGHTRARTVSHRMPPPLSPVCAQRAQPNECLRAELYS